MHFSHRTGSDRPNRIALAESEARAHGLKLGRLNDSNPTRFGLAPAFLPQVYEAEPRGPRKARQALAEFLTRRQSLYGKDRGIAVDPDNLYLLSSTSQAYSWLMKLLCDPGDAILEPRPGYPLIESIAGLECVRTIPYRLAYDGSWVLDLATVRQALEGPEGDRIRALVLINPNNPTGSYIHPEERQSLLELCQRHGVAIIADEVFFDYPLDPLPGRARLAGEDRMLTFALDGFSKSLAAPHAKVGWIQVSGPADQVAEAKRHLDMIADDYLPMSLLITRDMEAMLSDIPSQTSRVGERVRGNLEILRQALNQKESCVSLLRPEGGWNVLLRFPQVIDEEELILRLIGSYGLTGQPGYFFDMPGNGYLALSLLPESLEFRRNVNSVVSAIGKIMCL
ncbi:MULTISPECIES: pyridoxal phosphate-dependent aminotransferase [Bifidobacterium]|uniref:pyridoxal phosphate-dependent aminotransferase n=1 Tax=Bifidobacterium TaxID=1678 RepID=UPI000EF9D89C|nr:MULTISPECIES: pyridoxal phosphate-dependent aminotransferase [Bifidobacterium]MBI0145421.1 pyridoxal phosphate-dependent aminotransferase [Bifidobacterium polysaccharolyticum]MBI0152243.1 pyridoxal phosphate-dependent aminotransferase [Bifidobacterium sp. M0399]RMA47354.1 aminotransferase [Bifidobacterium sp. wkB338]